MGERTPCRPILAALLEGEDRATIVHTLLWAASPGGAARELAPLLAHLPDDVGAVRRDVFGAGPRWESDVASVAAELRLGDGPLSATARELASRLHRAGDPFYRRVGEKLICELTRYAG